MTGAADAQLAREALRRLNMRPRTCGACARAVLVDRKLVVHYGARVGYAYCTVSERHCVAIAPRCKHYKPWNPNES